MLAVLTGVSWLTGTGVPVHLVNTQTVVLTGVVGAFVKIDVTVSSNPAGLTDTLVAEQFINAHSTDTGFISAQVNLLFTPLTTETIRAVALEVID